jgi:hypothetical protein
VKDRGQRRKILSAYVRERLRSECAVRGVAAKISEATGFSTAHITNVQKQDRGVGQDFAEAMAGYWELTYDELVAEAQRWAKEHPEGTVSKAPPGASSTVNDTYPERAEGARIAIAAGVDQDVVARVLAEEVPPERAAWRALFWANRMQREALRGLPGAEDEVVNAGKSGAPLRPRRARKSA